MMDKQGFEPFTQALNKAGVETGNGRGFWGGVTPDDDIVVTIWTDQREEDGRFTIYRPKRRNGGLLDAWELGRIKEGESVKAILCRPRDPIQKIRNIHSAKVMPGRWRISGVDRDKGEAMIQPIDEVRAA